MYKIITIDGGGIKGIYALHILKMLEEEVDEGLLLKLDCMGGASTGALISAALIKGFKTKELIRFYKHLGKHIFPKESKSGREHSKYRQNMLRTVLRHAFSSKLSFADLSKHVIIPACQLAGSDNKRWQVKIYDNYHSEEAKEYNVVDALLESSAAPIYFSSYKGFTDGGLYALNCSLLALARAIDPQYGKQSDKEIALLSIGTGRSPIGIEENIDWGSEKWMSPYKNIMEFPLFSLMTEIAATVPEYPLQQILGSRYLRINQELLAHVEVDDYSKVDLLIESAENIRKHSKEEWEKMKEWVRTYFITN